MMINMYNSKIKSAQEAVKNSKAIALISDFWTSHGNESCCGVIGHWITDDCNLISVIPECVYVAERDFYDNIDELYEQFAKYWDMIKKIQVLVIDNA